MASRKKGRSYAAICFLLFLISSNDHNGFLEDCSIALIDKADVDGPTRREEYWKRVLETVTPYGLNTIDWLFHLGKFLKTWKILCIFWGKGVSIVKYLLLTYFTISICCFCLKIFYFTVLSLLLYIVIITITIIIARIVINVIVIVTVQESVVQGCFNVSFVATILVTVV